MVGGRVNAIAKGGSTRVTLHFERAPLNTQRIRVTVTMMVIDCTAQHTPQSITIMR